MFVNFRRPFCPLGGVLFFDSLLILLLVFNHSINAECDRCNFDGNDPSDCKDYGLVNTDKLVPWNLGSEECMAEYNIQISSPDPSSICTSSTSFVNELRFGSSLETAKNGLGESEGGFYNDDGTLKDSITVKGTTTDCQANSNNCYNAMKVYFAQDADGIEEMKQVCDTLQNKVVTDKQLEQSLLRIRLCEESLQNVDIPSFCDPLWEQLNGLMVEYSSLSCQGFGFGTQKMAIPGCESNSNVLAGNSSMSSGEKGVIQKTFASSSALCMMASLANLF